MISKLSNKTYLKTLIESYSIFCRMSRSAKVLLILILAAATAFGCWEMGPMDHSVRFNDRRTDLEFGRLPPIPAHETDERTMPYYHGHGEEVEQEYIRISNYIEKNKELWNLAQEAQSENDMWTLRKYLRQFLERTTVARSYGWGDPNEFQAERNSATDMLDALEALDHGSPLSAVQAYIAARASYDGTVEHIKEKLDEVRKDKNLADNAVYLEAALLYRDFSESAAGAFRRFAVKYPKSEKREAALFMAGAAAMKRSKSFENAQNFGAKSAPCPECRDEWKADFADFLYRLRQLMRDEKGRPVVRLNAALHGAIIVSLIAMTVL